MTLEERIKQYREWCKSQEQPVDRLEKKREEPKVSNSAELNCDPFRFDYMGMY